MDHRVVRRGAALSRTTSDFVVVASVDGRTVQANGSAAMLWRLLPEHDQEPVGISTIVEQLASSHRAPLELVAADTARLLDAWEAIGGVIVDS